VKYKFNSENILDETIEFLLIGKINNHNKNFIDKMFTRKLIERSRQTVNILHL